jgi:hypothetical protein
MRLFVVGLLSPLVLATSVCLAQGTKPPTPYSDYGACPFECCTYRRWTVEADTFLYDQRSIKSGIAFRVKKGDHVTGITGVVVTLKPGTVIVKKPMTIGLTGRKVRVKTGDILYLLNYMGEGVYKIWFRGKIYQHEMPTAPGLISKEPVGKREAFLHVVSQPDCIWWVRVKNRLGQVGWSRQNDHFGNMDSCG